MRTTVTLESGTEQLIRRRMRERGISFKAAINEAIREGLTHSSDRTDFRTPTADMGLPIVSLDRALQLAADVEDDELLRKQRTGK